MEQSTPSPYTCSWVFLEPKVSLQAQLGEDQTGEVKDGLYECLERMVPDETEQLEVHQQINAFTRATGTFGKNLAKIARDVDQPGKQFQSFFKFSCLNFKYLIF
jgi:hypothetical protein